MEREKVRKMNRKAHFLKRMMYIGLTIIAKQCCIRCNVIEKIIRHRKKRVREMDAEWNKKEGKRYNVKSITRMVEMTGKSHQDEKNNRTRKGVLLRS